MRKALRWSYYSADFGGTETLSKFTQKKGRSIDDPIAEGTATTVQASFARRDTVNSRKEVFDRDLEMYHQMIITILTPGFEVHI